MSTVEPTPSASSSSPARRTGKPTFWEDLVVTGFGLVTSTAVAWLSWWMATNWDFALYSLMIWFVIPAGALVCGMAAAIGYWAGARLFNHRPSRGLLFNIVLVSITTFFAIHHFHYSHDKVGGFPVSRQMSFGDYLVAVTENMTYKSERDHGNDAGTQLGDLGWGVAALQILGFSVGGFLVYRMLQSVPYCERCAKYLSEKKVRVAKWKEQQGVVPAYEEIAGLMQQHQLQLAIDKHAKHGEDRRLRIGSMLTLELRKCPGCENRRLLLSAQMRNGNQWSEAAKAVVFTEDPVQIG